MNMTHRIGAVMIVMLLADLLSNREISRENPELLILGFEMCITFYALMCFMPYILNKLKDKKLLKTYGLASPIIIIWAAMTFMREMKLEEGTANTSNIEFEVMLIGVVLVYITLILGIQWYIKKKKQNKEKLSI